MKQLKMWLQAVWYCRRNARKVRVAEYKDRMNKLLIGTVEKFSMRPSVTPLETLMKNVEKIVPPEAMKGTADTLNEEEGEAIEKEGSGTTWYERQVEEARSRFKAESDKALEDYFSITHDAMKRYRNYGKGFDPADVDALGEAVRIPREYHNAPNVPEPLPDCFEHQPYKCEEVGSCDTVRKMKERKIFPALLHYKCANCGNTCLQACSPHLTQNCGGCDNPNWKLMKFQEAYMQGDIDYIHPKGQI